MITDQAQPESSPAHSRHRLRSLLSRWLPIGFVLLGACLTVIYWLQPDRLAAVTMVPAWGWLVPVVIGTLVIRNRAMCVAVAIWVVFAVFHIEETKSLPRLLMTPANTSNEIISVATLNCNVGNQKALLEAMSTESDIILLQESPSPATLTEIASADSQSPWTTVWCGDNSILVHGQVQRVHTDQSSHFSHVVATLLDGTSIDVVSLRLSAPVYRLDFWTAGFWNDHHDNRIRHREQLTQIVEHLQQNQGGDHLVLGGDFNAVAGDGAMATTLTAQLTDSFTTAGVGWGGTGANDYPLFRVDQIWASRNLKCRRSRAIKTKNSDHRMVVSEFAKPL